jgi:hypothetical protein
MALQVGLEIGRYMSSVFVLHFQYCFGDSEFFEIPFLQKIPLVFWFD